MLLLRARTAARDYITHSFGVRHAIGTAATAKLWVDDRRFGATNAAALVTALRRARLAYPFAPRAAVERDLARRVRTLDLDSVAWDAQLPKTREPRVQRGIILKAPRGTERGLLYVAFEIEYATLLRHARLDSLARDYDLIIGPTWSPPYDLTVSLAARMWPGRRLFTVLSNVVDAPVFERLHPRFSVIPVLQSAWSDPALFKVEDTPKRFDLVIVSNFSPYKRHRALFAALAQAPRPLRVLIAGVPWLGGTEQTLRQLARAYGVEQQLTFLVNAPDTELRAAIRASRAAAIFSLIEGSCVAAAECLMLDVPLGMLENAHVGSLAFVNPQTGRRLRGGRQTGADLVQLVEDAPRLRPREWMLANGAECYGSTAVLNRTVRARVTDDGDPWTEDAAVHRFVRLRPEYVRPEDATRFSPLYADFASRYGVALEEPVRPPV